MEQETGKLVTKKNSRRKQKPEDAGLRLWAVHREESVYFQREAQVNFWTVLGGLAMAALLTQLSSLLDELRQGRWYLLFFLVASILVLATSWVQTSWGSLVMKWPISIISTVIVLFEMLAQSIQCLLVTNPFGWLATTAVLILCALLLQFHFERSGAWKVFPPEIIKRFRFNNMIYGLFVLICLAGAFQLYHYPSQTAEMVWGFACLSLSILALYMQHRGMQEEKRVLSIP
jgi:hypothetical protein